MSARNKPYDQYGPYILFKRLEADSLGDLWRAGRLEGSTLGRVVALRRLSGGNREAFVSAVHAASHILPQMTGTSFVRDQHAGVLDEVPFLSWEYAGGRSLRHIVDRARGGKDVSPNPIPLDQVVVIAEKVALSVATMADLRDASGVRLSHGALLPQFIWITDDGEIRVAGQQLGSAIMASMSDPKVAADAGRYFSPEYRQSGQPDKNADVYSLGAILFLLVTGHEPPDAATASAFGASVRAAKTMTGGTIPDDIRLVLDKSFNLDPSMRYASIADLKQAISALANGGRYSATTFNLAFYLSTLLKKEMESEAVDRDKESKVNVAPYLETPRPSAPAAVAHFTAPAAEHPPEAAKKSKVPLAAAAGLAIAALGVAGYMMLGKAASQPSARQVVAAQTLPAVSPPAPLIAEPIAVSATPASTEAAAGTTTADAEAQKKAFEDAVRQRMQAEMMKLQNDFMSDLKKKQSKDAPVNTLAPVSAPAVAAPAVAQSQPPAQAASDDRAAISAAQLDQQRRDARPEETAQIQRTVVPPQTQTTAPAVAAPAPAVAQVASIREGDVVDHNSLDVRPRMTRTVKPVYPPLAARQKIEATIFLTVFVSETGDVLDVKVLRGDNRFGLNDAAVRAMKSAQFAPGMKDGKRVRTWYPQSIVFKTN